MASTAVAWKIACACYCRSPSGSADLIYDAVGGPGLGELAWATNALAESLSIYGALGATDEETRLPLGACFFRGEKVNAGVTIFDYTGNPRLGLSPKQRAISRAKEFITKRLAAGNFAPKIDRVFNGLGEYQLAHQYMATNGRTGKIIISLH
jgi:NADPH:quinone reductase-like Zn-dependent oxidoreductase